MHSNLLPTPSSRQSAHRYPLQRSMTSFLLGRVLCLLIALGFLGTALFTSPVFAQTTIHVPADYPTIAQALAAARSGDTVQLAPGTYPEGMLNMPPGVSLVGNGHGDTIIDGGGEKVVLYPSDGATVRGVTIRGSGDGDFSAGIWISKGNVTISETRITGNATGLWAWCFEPESCNINITLDHNLIDNNRDNGINSNEFAVFTVRHNTITDNGGAGLILNNSASQAENNIIVYNGREGLLNRATAVTNHNNVWGNAEDYVGGASGDGGLTVAPLFRDAATGDYRLHAGSPLIGNGRPVGTTMGAIPFTPAGQPPAQVTLNQVDATTWRVQWSEQAGVGYQLYYGSCTRQMTTIVALGNVLTHQLHGVDTGEVGYVAVSTRDADGHESNVQLADGLQTPCPTPPTDLMVGAFPGGQIRLQWHDSAPNESGFEIERAEMPLNTITPTNFSLITTLPANSTVYTDTPPALETTYWYRVRAVNENGPSPYSDQSYNSTFSAVPNHDERYLHVLINEARAAPSIFGYDDIEPVPPVAYNPLLNYAAHSHSQSILNSGFLIGHCDAIDRCPDGRAAAVGYSGGGAENLVTGQTGPASVEEANRLFMGSGGHRDNRLCPCAQEIGIGHTYDPTKGGESYWKGQYTEQFAERRDRVLPNLPSGIAIPYSGDWTTEFTFIVNYYHPAGHAPQQALVMIDDQPNVMTLSTGNAANGTYRFTAKLAPGDHRYHFFFTFDGGSARLPAAQSYDLPVTGPETFQPGDGNGDGMVNTTDLNSCVQEIFDGDGIDQGRAYHGRMAGTSGCDANGDAKIEAADLSCIVQIIGHGAGSCGTVAAATVATTAELTIGAVEGAGGNSTIPIQLESAANEISALSFALYPGPGFDPADNNGDGMPDAVVLGSGVADLLVTAAWQNGRLDVAMVDISAPISPLADGTLLSLTFADAETAAVAFDTTILPSLGSPTGAAVPVQSPVGSVKVFLPLVAR